MRTQAAPAAVSDASRILHARYPVVFFVPGTPQTKGSHRAFVVKGRAVMSNDNPKEKGWRATIGIVAHEAMGDWPLFDGPVRIELTFYRPRPKAHLNSKGEIKPRFGAALPDTKPDWDKMGRSVGDALNGICYRDDAQITAGLVLKDWGPSGVRVTVGPDKREAA